MPLESPLPAARDRAAELNDRYRHHAAHDVVAHALTDAQVGHVALVSSFGAESVALLHMVAKADRTVPVIFLDTEMLFPETIAYQRDLAGHLGLTDLRIFRPDPTAIARRDPTGTLNSIDTDACCALRKSAPLTAALGPFDAWITGRKRYQSGQRAGLPFFEADGDGRLKINPLAHWSQKNVQDYIENNDLPRHPLVTRGYPSIGCAPCTTPVAPGEDARSGRWRGQDKDECGIHFINGKAVRGPIGANP